MKKLLSATLILALALALTACCCVNIPTSDTPSIDSMIKDNPITAIPEEMLPTEVDNSAIEEYLDKNKDVLISSMESSFAGSSGMTCTSDVWVEGMGIAISININEFDNMDDATKQLMQEAYDTMGATFDSALATMQQELPELEYFEVRVCEVDGDLLATVVAGEK